MPGINLLPQEILEEHKTRDRIFLINVTSVAVLVILVSLVLMLFSYRLYLTRQEDDLKSQLSTVTHQIEKKRLVEGKLQSLHRKLNLLGEIFTGRPPYPVILGDLQEALGEKGNLDSVSVKEDGKTMVQVNVVALADLADALARLEEKGYRGLEIKSVRFSGERGVFRAEINLEKGKAGKS